jgi:hypothetical protein
MRCYWLICCFGLMLCFVTMLASAQASPVPEQNYVGNVHGFVTDSQTGRPVRGVKVIVVPDDVTLTVGKSKEPSILLKDPEVERVLPRNWQDSLLYAYTDEKGEFLISAVPTPYPFKRYTVIADRADYGKSVLKSIRVMPGAVMMLEVTFRLIRNGSNRNSVFTENNPNAPFYYRNERATSVPAAVALSPQANAVVAGNFFVWGTREGLVGATTANGHVIVANDHFVALPSRRALSSNNGFEFQAQLSLNGRTVIAPVWDIGPWNIRDDYWDPSNIREEFTTLAQNLPEAQAAFQNHFNNGLSDSGRVINNPAGVDLADGTSSDLGSGDGAWMSVELLRAPDTIPPTVGPLTAVPSTISLGSSTGVRFTISDSGDSGLDRAELWRAPDISGRPGTWTDVNNINGLIGNGPITLTIIDTPPSRGGFWYGVHVFDRDGNQTNEPAIVKVIVQ